MLQLSLSSEGKNHLNQNFIILVKSEKFNFDHQISVVCYQN